MQVNVLGHGSIELVDHMISDPEMSVVNAARVSFNATADEFGDREAKLIGFLWREQHTSPFRHWYASYRIRVPIFVARQWAKHQVGCAWNEESARYTQVKNDFWLPESLRVQNKSGNKQGSAGEHEDSHVWLGDMERVMTDAVVLYERMVAAGIAREQARAVLPQGVFTSFIWTASLQALVHFFRMRLDPNAQPEIQECARALIKASRPVLDRVLVLIGRAA